MSKHTFFEEQKEQSFVKSTIVEKYFDVWAKIIIQTQNKYPEKTQKIAYIDLFAGPGRYNDGTQSTPLRILTKAIEDKDLCDRLVTIFNDKDENSSKSLENTIFELPGIEKLKYTPKICNNEVGEEIVNMFESKNLVPTLFFVDPWGYKGLSLRLINSVVKDWGCDAIFFFNYNRVSMGLSNEKVKTHMQALFGDNLNKINSLNDSLNNKSPKERELLIIEELCQVLKSNGSNFVLPFRFKNDKGTRTSHHLIFVSKHFRGYEKMKEIMAEESTSNTQGVPSFEYNPADYLPQQTLLFQLSKPLDDLKEDLMEKFKGQKITMKEIYESHSVDTPYIKKNYKEILRSLFENGNIEATSVDGKPPQRGFADHIIVSFPI